MIKYDGFDNSMKNLSRRQFLAATAAIALSGYRIKTNAIAPDVVVIEGIGRAGNIPLSDQIKHSLDRALSLLTGQKQAQNAWSSLFKQGDRVSVKIDGLSPLAYTNPVITGTLLERLFDLNIQPWDITVWDKRISDINRITKGIQTRRGTQEITATESANQLDTDMAGYRKERGYHPKWLEGSDFPPMSHIAAHLSDGKVKIVNLPTPKHHPLVGIDGSIVSLAFGSLNNVNRFRSSAETMARALAEILKLKQLSGYMLTIMDATRLVFNGGPVGLPLWTAETGALIMGFDPVAVDSVALEMIEARCKVARLPALGEAGLVMLKEAEKQGVGTTKPNVVHLNATA